MNTQQYIGLGVALITPFNADFSIDFSALENLTDRLISEGADYLVILGTTAETPTLTTEEKNKVIRTVVNKTNKRVPLMLGFSDNSTSRLIENLNNCNLDGIDSILSVTPYYNKPSQRGLIAHFTALADISPLPILLYNVPGRTGVNMLPETVFKLSSHNNIFGIKEASGNTSQIEKLIDMLPKDYSFLIISGDDELTLNTIKRGGHGVISVLANAYPKAWNTLVHAALDGDYSTANKLQEKYKNTIHSIFENGNPAGIKALLHEMNICENILRLPSVSVENYLLDKIKALYNENK